MAERHHRTYPSPDDETGSSLILPSNVRGLSEDDVPSTLAPEADAFVMPPIGGGVLESPVPVSAPAVHTTPSAHTVPPAVALTPTLSAAFTVLCAALYGHLDDNQVLAQHCEEIQAWHANAGGDERHVNSIMAWRHAVQLLEAVLGQSMKLG